MNFLNQLSIRTKLLIISIFPLIGIFYFSLVNIKIRYENLQNKILMKDLAVFAIKTSSMIHELQKEREISNGFIGSKGTKFGSELKIQIKETDQKINDFLVYTKQIQNTELKLQENIKNILLKFEDLKNHREIVSSLSIKEIENFSFYTNFIKDLLDLYKYFIIAIKNELVLEYYLLTYGKEFAGQERATVNVILSSEKINQSVFNRFLNIVAHQNSYLNFFLFLADENLKNIYNEKIKENSFQEVERIRNQLMEDGTNFKAEIQPEYWFTTSTKRINLLKEIEDEVANRIVVFSNESIKKAQFEITFYIIITIILITLTLVITFTIYKYIIREIENFKTITVDENDLTKRIEIHSKDEMALLGNWFNNFINKIHIIIKGMKDYIDGLNQISVKLSDISQHFSASMEEMSKQSQNIASSATEMSHNFQVVSSSAEEMVISIGEVAKKTTDASQMASEANETIDSTTQIMQELEKSAKDIGQIVETITSIAKQTNLLALNAAIEAAGAGDAGRGFAVVASEVKELARQAAEATVDIKNKIQAIQNSSQKSIEAIHYIAKILKDLSTISNLIASAMEEQSITTKEITKNITQSLQAANIVSQNIEEFAHVINEGSRNSVYIAELSVEIEKIVKDLNRIYNQFKI